MLAKIGRLPVRYVKLRKDKAEIKYSGTDYNLEVFHMHEKQIPVDSVEIKETIHAFAWELAGSKFAVIHGEPPSTSVSFYEVKTGQTPTFPKKYELIATLWSSVMVKFGCLLIVT